MTFIRGQERMVSQTVGEYLFTQLDALGWFAQDAPFGATGPLHLIDYVPAAHQELQPNTLGFTAGPELPDDEGELGASWGGLWLVNHVFFVDLYGESQGIARALASDVKAILNGRLPGCGRIQQMRDFTTTPPSLADGHFIEFSDVQVETPPEQPYKRTWRVVKLIAQHQFSATDFEDQEPMGAYSDIYTGDADPGYSDSYSGSTPGAYEEFYAGSY